jgi:hypothetical protein
MYNHLDPGDALLMRADEIEIGSPEEDTDEDEARQQLRFVKRHPSIIRIYGSNPPVTSRFII